MSDHTRITNPESAFQAPLMRASHMPDSPEGVARLIFDGSLAEKIKKGRTLDHGIDESIPVSLGPR